MRRQPPASSKERLSLAYGVPKARLVSTNGRPTPPLVGPRGSIPAARGQRNLAPLSSVPGIVGDPARESKGDASSSNAQHRFVEPQMSERARSVSYAGGGGQFRVPAETVTGQRGPGARGGPLQQRRASDSVSQAQQYAQALGLNGIAGRHMTATVQQPPVVVAGRYPGHRSSQTQTWVQGRSQAAGGAASAARPTTPQAPGGGGRDAGASAYKQSVPERAATGMPASAAAAQVRGSARAAVPSTPVQPTTRQFPQSEQPLRRLSTGPAQAGGGSAVHHRDGRAVSARHRASLGQTAGPLGTAGGIQPAAAGGIQPVQRGGSGPAHGRTGSSSELARALSQPLASQLAQLNGGGQQQHHADAASSALSQTQGPPRTGSQLQLQQQQKAGWTAVTTAVDTPSHATPARAGGGAGGLIGSSVGRTQRPVVRGRQGGGALKTSDDPLMQTQVLPDRAVPSDLPTERAGPPAIPASPGRARTPQHHHNSDGVRDALRHGNGVPSTPSAGPIVGPVGVSAAAAATAGPRPPSSAQPRGLTLAGVSTGAGGGIVVPTLNLQELTAAQLAAAAAQQQQQVQQQAAMQAQAAALERQNLQHQAVLGMGSARPPSSSLGGGGAIGMGALSHRPASRSSGGAGGAGMGAAGQQQLSATIGVVRSGTAAGSSAAGGGGGLMRPGDGFGPTGRPSSAGSEGSGIIDVGVAEDPNIRHRHSMEDAHVVKLGFGDPRSGMRSPSPAPSPLGAGATLSQTAKSFGFAGAASGASAAGRAVSPKPGLRPKIEEKLSSAGGRRPKGGLFAIFDGHGGREAVNYLEKNFHKELEKQMQKLPPQKALEETFLATDAVMAKNQRYQECGSTAVVALVRPAEGGGRELYVANVGDASAVIATNDAKPLQQAIQEQSDGQPLPPVGASLLYGPGSQRYAAATQAATISSVKLSYPHVATDQKEQARIRREGGQVFMNRVMGSLAVSRALGDHALKRNGVSAQPYSLRVPITKNDKFVIVGCDGVWDVITEQEAVNAVAGMKDAKAMAQKIVDMSMEMGTTDNVSAMVIRLND